MQELTLGLFSDVTGSKHYRLSIVHGEQTRTPLRFFLDFKKQETFSNEANATFCDTMPMPLNYSRIKSNAKGVAST